LSAPDHPAETGSLLAGRGVLPRRDFRKAKRKTADNFTIAFMKKINMDAVPRL
jgi:hypothetical protein